MRTVKKHADWVFWRLARRRHRWSPLQCLHLRSLRPVVHRRTHNPKWCWYAWTGQRPSWWRWPVRDFRAAQNKGRIPLHHSTEKDFNVGASRNHWPWKGGRNMRTVRVKTYLWGKKWPETFLIKSNQTGNSQSIKVSTCSLPRNTPKSDNAVSHSDADSKAAATNIHRNATVFLSIILPDATAVRECSIVY